MSPKNFWRSQSPVLSLLLFAIGILTDELRTHRISFFAMADFFTSLSSPGRSPLRSSSGSAGSRSSENPFPPRVGHPSPMQENVVEYYSDRFIPSRAASNLEAGFALIDEQQRVGRASPPSGGAEAAAAAAAAAAATPGSEGGGASQNRSQPTLNMLLRSELLGVDCASPKHDRTENSDNRSAAAAAASNGAAAASPPRNLFRFKTALNTMNENPRSLYDLSPVGEQSQRLLLSPRKAKRKIPKVCGGHSWKNAKKKNKLQIGECGVRSL